MIKIKANFQIQLAKIHELFSGQLKNEKNYHIYFEN